MVKCDITNVPPNALQLRWNYETGERYTLAYLTCRIRATLSTLEVEVLVTDGVKATLSEPVKETNIGHVTIQLSEGGTSRRKSFDSEISDL